VTREETDRSDGIIEGVEYKVVDGGQRCETEAQAEENRIGGLTLPNEEDLHARLAWQSAI
jgi:hypothetical protein